MSQNIVSTTTNLSTASLSFPISQEQYGVSYLYDWLVALSVNDEIINKVTDNADLIKAIVADESNSYRHIASHTTSLTKLASKLENEPIYALTLAFTYQDSVGGINTENIQSLKMRLDGILDAWIHEKGWALQFVASHQNASSFVALNDGCTPIISYRYLLHDVHSTGINELIQLKQDFSTLLATQKFDCHILPLAKAIRPHKLAFFDMDSTLIEQEVIVELAKHAGIGKQVSEITESAMRGEIDFSESFTKRVALLEGLSTDVLDEICGQLTLSAGAKTLITTLKTSGYHTVLVSGGFTYFARYIAKTLGIDEYHANELDICDNQVTGKVITPIIDGNRKAEIVKQVASRLSISLSEVVCVGDGANDLEMMAIADIGIAYRAKPVVQSQADTAINVLGLDGVLTIVSN